MMRCYFTLFFFSSRRRHTRYWRDWSSDVCSSHLDDAGRARMVDVGGKPVTERRAVARSIVTMSPQTAAALARGDSPKGDVLGTARIAGIQAAKRTAELVPLCHSLPLSFVDVRGELADDRVVLTAEARTSAQTGVE